MNDRARVAEQAQAQTTLSQLHYLRSILAARAEVDIEEATRPLATLIFRPKRNVTIDALNDDLDIPAFLRRST